jgi:hypothetical protein
MLNEDLFIIYEQYPQASYIPFDFSHVSDQAWTFACNAAYATTPFNDENHTNEILSITQEGDYVFVVLCDVNGSLIFEQVDITKYYYAKIRER